MRNVPPQLLPPVITKVDPDADPVMSLVVSSDTMSLRTLTEIADKQVAPRHPDGQRRRPGQRSAAAAPAKSTSSSTSQKLNAYGLSMAQVSDAVVAENIEIPGGTVEQGKGQLLLRTLGRVDATEDFNNIVVATKNGTPIRVSDIGYAEDTFERPTTRGLAGRRRRRCCSTSAARWARTPSRSSKASSAKIADDPARRCRRRSTMTVIRDDSRFIYASVESLEEHLLFGSLFAAIVVMVFIRNIRAVVIIASLAIPASIISSFTLMRVMGFTLNNMTLLGITLAVGIVIDDAIVVLENIFRHIEEKDCDAVRGGDQGHARGGAGGDGDDAVAGGHLPADRVHDRLRASASSTRSAGRWRSRSWCRCWSASR